MLLWNNRDFELLGKADALTAKIIASVVKLLVLPSVSVSSDQLH
jgi:hypothetical protein